MNKYKDRIQELEQIKKESKERCDTLLNMFNSNFENIRRELEGEFISENYIKYHMKKVKDNIKDIMVLRNLILNCEGEIDELSQ